MERRAPGPLRLVWNTMISQFQTHQEWDSRGARPPGHLLAPRILSTKAQRAAAALRHSRASRAAGGDADQEERLGRGKQ